MDKYLILRKLKAGVPLFTAFPRVHHIRVCGTESEYGIKNRDGQVEAAFERLPLVLLNGGEVYKDCEHVEYCSPETSNAVSAVAYYEAGKIFCTREKFSPKLYCNNNDWHGNTYGAHESYFTCAPRAAWPALIPFLVARTVICGSGWFTDKKFFEISQRARHMEEPEGEHTTSNRSILNTRHEPLAKVPGWDRLHLICGDANMCEMALFLKIAFTLLVLEMLELRALPPISYDENQAVKDLKAIARKTGNWYLKGIRGRSRGVVDLLFAYLERAKELFTHRDEPTDVALVVLEDTIEKLGDNPMELFGRLDWVTKLSFLNAFNGACPESTAEWLMSQDLEYHDLDPDTGLYWQARSLGVIDGLGVIERLIDDSLIEQAVCTPPQDTRAYARGHAAAFLKGTGLYLCAGLWRKLIAVRERTRCTYEQQSMHLNSLLEEEIIDPRKPHHEGLERFKNRFNLMYR